MVALGLTIRSFKLTQQRTLQEAFTSELARQSLLFDGTRCGFLNGTSEEICAADLGRLARIAEKKRYLGWSEATTVAPCCLTESNPYQRNVTLGDVLVLVVGSNKTIDRIRTARDTWAKAFPHVVFASDVTDASLGMVTAPSIEGLGEYKDAGRRQLAVYQQMVAQKDPLAEKPYVLFVDDDTFVNSQRLLTIIRGVNPTCPVSIGYVWDHNMVPDLDYTSGGAGMLTTHECIRRVEPLAFTPQCTYPGYGDSFFGRCAVESGCAVVHSNAFSWSHPASFGQNKIIWPTVVESVTYHYIDRPNAEMLQKFLDERRQYVDELPL